MCIGRRRVGWEPGEGRTRLRRGQCRWETGGSLGRRGSPYATRMGLNKHMDGGILFKAVYL
jgi:hypothetical protein